MRFSESQRQADRCVCVCVYCLGAAEHFVLLSLSVRCLPRRMTGGETPISISVNVISRQLRLHVGDTFGHGEGEEGDDEEVEKKKVPAPALKTHARSLEFMRECRCCCFSLACFRCLPQRRRKALHLCVPPLLELTQKMKQGDS